MSPVSVQDMPPTVGKRKGTRQKRARTLPGRAVEGTRGPRRPWLVRLSDEEARRRALLHCQSRRENDGKGWAGGYSGGCGSDAGRGAQSSWLMAQPRVVVARPGRPDHLAPAPENAVFGPPINVRAKSCHILSRGRMMSTHEERPG